MSQVDLHNDNVKPPAQQPRKGELRPGVFKPKPLAEVEIRRRRSTFINSVANDPQLSVEAKALGAYLAVLFSAESGGSVISSAEKLADMLGKPRDVTRLAQRELVKRGFITIRVRAGVGKIYTMTPAKAEAVVVVRGRTVIKTPTERLRWIHQVACDPEVSAAASNVAAVLACDFSKPEKKDQARPVIATIVASLNLHEKIVRRALRNLTDRGHIQIDRRPGYEDFYSMIAKAEAR